MYRKQVLWLMYAVIAVFGWGGSVQAAEQKVTLMLSGKFCDAYLGDVREALTKVAGVKDVDFKSMKGHAVVTVEDGKASADQLAKAVNAVKGDGWHCTAQAMK
jgi:copper chaperone CopZ